MAAKKLSKVFYVTGTQHINHKVPAPKTARLARKGSKIAA